MTRDDIRWPAPPPEWRFPTTLADEVLVWAVLLDVAPEWQAPLAATLSAEELNRAARFRSERHRGRFIIGRSILRTVLGRCLQAEPRSIEFAYGAQGKPALAGTFAESGWHFNLAHSEDLALIALTQAGPVGVDVERVRVPYDAGQLVARCSSSRESAAFNRLAEEEKPAAFFNLWTRKEAWLKATGEGIGASLDRVEVSFLPGEPRLLALPGPAQVIAPWMLWELTPASGFAAALAVAAEVNQLHCWRWA